MGSDGESSGQQGHAALVTRMLRGTALPVPTDTFPGVWELPPSPFSIPRRNNLQRGGQSPMGLPADDRGSAFYASPAVITSVCRPDDFLTYICAAPLPLSAVAQAWPRAQREDDAPGQGLAAASSLQVLRRARPERKALANSQPAEGRHTQAAKTIKFNAELKKNPLFQHRIWSSGNDHTNGEKASQEGGSSSRAKLPQAPPSPPNSWTPWHEIS